MVPLCGHGLSGSLGAHSVATTSGPSPAVPAALDTSLAGMGYANNYGVTSNMPPGEPTKRVEIVDVEDLVRSEIDPRCRLN